MKRKNEWVICFGSKWYGPSVYTEKQLINRFYKDGLKILWVNPIPIKNISISGISTNRSVFKKIFLRLKSHIIIFSKVKKDFYLINPFFIPNVENEKVRYYNNKILNLQIKIFLNIFMVDSFIIISSALTDINHIFPKRNFKYFLQFSGDLYSDFRNLSKIQKQYLATLEARVFNYADYILTASRRIFEKTTKIVKNKEKVIYFPHGVEFEHFNNVKDLELKNIQKPIIGYFGSLTDNNDKRMFTALAEAGFSLVLIGEVLGDYSSCNHRNIHFIGAVEYQKLPRYANNFDVCIMAWKPAEWLNNSNPSKTLEYFAMGKPIVSNTIPELKHRFSKLMYFADTPDEFVSQVNKALIENNEDLILQRVKVAKKESWDEKYLFIKKLINV
jgi:glycosyltransferase involved in cell wall biosynthesis